MNSELPPHFNSENFPSVTVFFDSTQFYDSVVSEPAASDIIKDLFIKFDRDPLLNSYSIANFLAAEGGNFYDRITAVL